VDAHYRGKWPVAILRTGEVYLQMLAPGHGIFDTGFEYHVVWDGIGCAEHRTREEKKSREAGEKFHKGGATFAGRGARGRVTM
jgi:hypothetical protein